MDTSPAANSPTSPADTSAEAPAASAAAAASETPAAAPVVPAAKPVDDRKGLPPIQRATVVASEGSAPRREPFRPGQRGPRPVGGDGPKPEPVPDTQSTLRELTGKNADAGIDAEAASAMDAAMASATPKEKAPAKKKPEPVIKAAAAHVRGPRVVQGGREHRRGTVVSVGPTDIFIEFGPKELGVVQRTQYPEGEQPAVGAEIEVVVDRFETSESLYICSRPGAVQKAAWELLEVGQTIEARVTGVNKGGLELEVAGHRAFMPASQASLDRVADLSVFIGEKFTCQVTQLDRRGSGNIVLSRRDLLNAERKEKAEKLKATLAEGQTVEGTVRKIMPFGAFVDLGGIDGLLHLSDMTYDRVMPGEKNVAKYVKEGDKVKVKILKLDLEGNRISLGMKQLSADPFAVATSEIVEGATVTGRVVRLTEFGAFIELAPGVDGLMHISEISRKRINKVEDVLKKDQVVTVQVLKIEPDSRKISLSMKALEPVAPAEPPRPGSREAKAAEREAAAKARLEEIAKVTPELRRQREKFRNKELKGGFGKKYDDGGGLAGLKIG